MRDKYKCIINNEEYFDISTAVVKNLLKKCQVPDTVIPLINTYLKTAFIKQRLHIRTGPYNHEIDIYLQKTA